MTSRVVLPGATDPRRATQARLVERQRLDQTKCSPPPFIAALRKSQKTRAKGENPYGKPEEGNGIPSQ